MPGYCQVEAAEYDRFTSRARVIGGEIPESSPAEPDDLITKFSIR